MELETLLHQLERDARNEMSISNQLRQLSKTDELDTVELLAEKMAFDFHPDYRHDITDWNTYYGPQTVWSNHDGTANVWPHYSRIDEHVLAYWRNRAFKCTNPIMSGRYADLVWDFQHKATGERPSHEICQRCIKSYLNIAKEKVQIPEVDVFKKLERALSLSITINDKQLIAECKDAILDYEAYAAKDELPGLWGYGFDLLLSDKKVDLSKDEKDRIINELEDRLIRVSTGNDADAWATEQVVTRLASHYNKLGDKHDVQRVIEHLEIAHGQRESTSTAMQICDWLTDLARLYKQYGLLSEEKRILVRLREVSAKVNDEMSTFPVELKLTKEEIDDCIDPIIAGSVEEVLHKIVLCYTPKKGKAHNEILDKKYSLQNLFSTIIFDDKGRAIGSLGSVEKNIDRHVAKSISDHLWFSSIFLKLTFDKAMQLHADFKEHVLQFIKSSPVFFEERYSIIELGLKYYFEGNYIVAIHLLIPQIEESTRNLIELAGGNVLKTNKIDGFNLKTFDEVLQDNILEQIVKEDKVNYFRILFTNQLGWNLRNKTMHGNCNPEFFNRQVADRLLHALLCMATVRRNA